MAVTPVLTKSPGSGRARVTCREEAGHVLVQRPVGVPGEEVTRLLRVRATGEPIQQEPNTVRPIGFGAPTGALTPALGAFHFRAGAGTEGRGGDRQVRVPRVRCPGRCRVYATLADEPAPPTVRT
ncbi:hypothetical protein GCM10010518_53360 [Kitasatospora cinereorecta]